MTRCPHEAADDSRKGYELAIRAARELCIRRGQILPDCSRPEEIGWAEEGVLPSSMLTVVRNG